MRIVCKKKRGFILIEVMIMASIIFLLASMYVNKIVWNINKSSLYTVNDDLLYMNDDELKFIDEVKDIINKDIELKSKLNEEKDFESLNYEYSKDKMSFTIDKGNIFLVEKISNNLLFRELKLVRNNEEVIIIPKYYKAYNLQ